MKGEGKVEVETRIELTGVDMEKLRQDPVGTVTEALKDKKLKRTDKVTMTLDQQFPLGPMDLNGSVGSKVAVNGKIGEGQAGTRAGKGRTIEVSITIENSPSVLGDVLKTAVKDRNLGGAIERAADAAKIEAKVTDYTEVVLAADGKIGAPKVGSINAKVEGTVRDVEDNPYRYPPPLPDGSTPPKTVRDLVADLERFARGEPLPPPPPAQRLGYQGQLKA